MQTFRRRNYGGSLFTYCAQDVTRPDRLFSGLDRGWPPTDTRTRIIAIEESVVGRRRVANPLALAVLGCLAERPMHPYEMSATMRERGKHESIKLNYGSLYTVVESLQKHGLIAVRETVRQGRRPERTVYEITEAGRFEFTDWLTELISTPTKEYSAYEAGLSLLGGLGPDGAQRALRARTHRLRAELEAGREMLRQAEQLQVPRLFLIEGDYRQG